jgi:hypothetical protein
MFSLMAEVMVTLDPMWRVKLTGVTCDGAADMAGRFARWQKLIHRARALSTGLTVARIVST